MRRQIRTKLDLINPKLSDRVLDSQNNKKKQHNYHAIERSLEVGDPVFCENFSRGYRWLTGYIIQKPGPLSCVIKLSDGRIIRRHHDHVRIRSLVEVSRDNIPADNMILPAMVPVDTPVQISIVPSQPVASEPEPDVYRTLYHQIYYVYLNVPSMYRIV